MASRPDFRIACCLCRNPLPRSSDAYLLDHEFRRRHPDMIGNLACGRCATGTYFTCRTADKSFVPGHLPSTRKGDRCSDAWHHIERWGTHIAMVLSDPASGLAQGAEEYLLHVLRGKNVNGETAQRIQAALDARDAAR